MSNIMIPAPNLSANEPVALLSEWHVNAGDFVNRGDQLCELLTNKISFSVESEHSGYIGGLLPIRTKIRATEPLAFLFASSNEALSAVYQSKHATKGPVFSRRARESLKKLNLLPETFSDLQFVTEKDIHERAGSTVTTAAKDAEIIALRTAYLEAYRSSVTVRYFPSPSQCAEFSKPFYRPAYFAYHAAQTLVEIPRFLSGPCSATPKVDIGYAIDNGEGPLQFLAKRAETWDIESWKQHLTQWSLAVARERVLPSQLGSGSFTITDLSSLGVWLIEPLLVFDQSAILGIGGDSEGPAPQFTLTLAFDHKIHNGRQAAEFLTRLRDRLHLTP